MPEIARILETGLIWFLDSRQSLWTSCSVLSAGICTIFGSERYTKGNVLPLYEGQSCFPPLCGSKPPMSNRISRSSAASSIPSFCLSTVGAASAPLQGQCPTDINFAANRLSLLSICIPVIRHHCWRTFSQMRYDCVFAQAARRCSGRRMSERRRFAS